MQQASSGTATAARLARPVALAAALAALPTVAGAQGVYVEEGRYVAERAFRQSPASLAIELTPFALGDSLAGAGLGVNAAVAGSAAVGLHSRIGGTQYGLWYGSRSFGSIGRAGESGFGLTAGRPLWSGQLGSRASWTVGAVGAIGFRRGTEMYRSASGGASIAAPVTMRLRLTAPQPTSDERSWRSAWRFAPALAVYAAPVLGYGFQRSGERTFLLTGDTTRVSGTQALLPQLHFGARIEGLGPLHFQLGWRVSPGEERYYGTGMSASLGITIR